MFVTRDALQRRLSLKWSDQDAGLLPAWVAETDFTLPAPLAERLVAAVHAGDVGYPPRDARSPLGQAWSRHLRQAYDWSVQPEDVHALPGVVGGLYAVIGAFSQRGGDVVVMPPIYKPFLDAPAEMERRRVDVPLLDDGTRYRLDLAGLEAALEAGAGLVLLCHPHNPTGTVFPPEELRALADLARTYQAVVVSDEIHAPLTLTDGLFHPLAVIAGSGADVVTLVSMSKAFSFAGLKCGAAIVPASLRERWTAYPRRLRSGPGVLGVIATVAALEQESQGWLADAVSVIARNVDETCRRLPDLLPGARVRRPEASYLMWVDTRSTRLGPDPAATLAMRGVRLSPGEEFGQGGAGFVRLNVATSPEMLEEMLCAIGGRQHADTGC